MPPSSMLKPPLWAWDPAFLEPRFRELARGLSLLIPFWDDDSGAVNTSQLVDLASEGHQLSAINGGGTDWTVTPYGVGVKHSSDAVNQLEYSTFKGFTSGGKAGSAFMLVNENGSADDNGFIGPTDGSIELLWWRDSPNRMVLRLRTTSHRGTDNAFPADRNTWYALGFSFTFDVEGLGRNVSGYIDGTKVLNVTPGQFFPSIASPFCIGAEGVDRTNQNSYAIAACWDRSLTQQEQELLADDPFGLLRPAPLLKTEEVAAPTVTPAVISTALVLPAPTVVVPALVAPAAIVTSLSVPTPTIVEPGQVDTSPQSTTTIRYNGRKILRTSNGTIWVIVVQASDTVPRLRYSTDDGANWATSSTAFAEAIESREASWVFCSDGAIYILYNIAANSEIRVRKGTLNGAHTDITWSAATTVNTASSQRNFDIAAHEEGGDTIVHVVYTNTLFCRYKRAVWGSAFGSEQSLSTWVGFTVPRIEFHHTLADITAVKDSTPHIYVSWFDNGRILFRKAVYSGGSWTWNAARTITSDAKGYQSFSMSFDGTSCVMVVESQGTAEALLVLERDAADTTTTSLANTPTRTGTATSYTDITYNPDRDIEVFHSDSTAKVMQRVTYDRSGSAWGSWATIDADADDLYPNVKIGYWSGSKADSVEVIWMDQTGPPYLLMYERFTFVVSATVTPGVIATVLALPAPTIAAAATLTPGVITTISTLLAPSVTVAPTVTPSVIAAISALSAPSIAAAATTAPAVIPTISTIPTPSIIVVSTVAPGVIATLVTLPTPLISADPIVVTPALIAAISALPAPTPSIAATTTPALITTISALPTPTVYWSWTLKAGFDTARFYRLGATQLILVRGISRSAAVGYSAKESWATCSGAFAVPNTRAAQVVTAVQAVWAANTGASDAALTLLVNEALNDAGYRKPNGAVIS